jgi:hypothetical protein
VCANTSYQQSAEDIQELMGIKVGHSTLHRLVQRVELPMAETEIPSEGVSVDGGKICIRGEEERGEWRDYKLVSLHGGLCEAFFQEPERLEQWSKTVPLAPILTCLGDGHPGVWNVMRSFGGEQVVIKREVLDWYHLKENLYKIGGSLKRLEMVENYLWQGWVEQSIKELEKLKGKLAVNFRAYLERHRSRIPCYSEYQRLGITIGSGDVESRIKQVGARVKRPGARWEKENVRKILRLRCAYLNRSPLLSISA